MADPVNQLPSGDDLFGPTAAPATPKQPQLLNAPDPSMPQAVPQPQMPVTGNTSEQAAPDMLQGEPAPTAGAPPKPANDEAALPTDEDLFGPKPESEFGAALDAKIRYGTGTMGELGQKFMDTTAVGRVLTAFGHGASEGWGAAPIGISDETRKELEKAGIFNDYSKNERNILKAFASGVLTPAAAVFDMAIRGFGAAFHAYQSYGVQLGTEIGGDTGRRIARDVVSLPDVFAGSPHIGPAPPNAAAIARLREGDLTRAKSLGVIGESEGVYAGTRERRPLTPEEVAENQRAAREQTVEQNAEATGTKVAEQAKEPGQSPPPVEALPDQQVPPTPHEVARQMAPQLFDEYDSLVARQQTYRRWIDELDTTRRTRLEADSAAATEIARLEARMEEATPRLQKKYEARIAALEEERRLQVDEKLIGDSPEMARIRAELQKTDYALRDMAPMISAAMREAEATVGETARRAPEPARAAEPPREAAAEARPAPTAETVGARPIAPAETAAAPTTAPELRAPAVVGEKLGGGTKFRTAKGSTYEVGADGATTRNKSFHPEHGVEDQGPQPKSQHTFYVSAEDALKLAEIQAQGGPKRAIVRMADGRYGLKYLEGKDAGKIERRTVVEAKAGPEVGLTPVELWNDGQRVHFGNEIVEVTPASGQATAQPARPIAEQKAAIASDIQRQLEAAGRSPEEAEAAGALIAARYEARAERMGGALGSAEELYKAEAPKVVGAGDRARVQTAREVEMAQRPRELFQGPDEIKGHPEGEIEDKAWRKLEPQKSADGKYKGAPDWVDSPAKLGQMRKLLLKLVDEGKPGRFWYEESARTIMRVVKNDVLEARKLIGLVALYSPQTPVFSNMNFAIKAYNQFLRGEKISVKTGFQDTTAEKWLRDGTDWGGRKTNSFNQNLMHEIVTSATPEELAKLPAAEVADAKRATVDLWVLRAMGYDVDAAGSAGKAFGEDTSASNKYGFTENELRRLAGHLNEGLETGDVRWLPHQVQAALWSSIKGRFELPSVKAATAEQSFAKGYARLEKNAETGEMEKIWPGKGDPNRSKHMALWRENALKADDAEVAKQIEDAKGSFADAINRVAQNVTWEAVPSTSVGAEINGAPPAVRKAFTKDALSLITDDTGADELARRLGVNLNYSEQGTGAYAGGLNPNVVSTLVPEKPAGSFDAKTADAYARAIQFIYKQDAVPLFRADAKADFDKNYIAVSEKGRKRFFATPAAADEFIAAEAKKGRNWTAEQGNFERGVRINFGAELDEAAQTRLLKELEKELGPGAGYTKISPTEVVVINFKGEGGRPAVDDLSFGQAIKRMVDGPGKEMGVKDVGEFGSEGRYGPVHDWKADPDGAGLSNDLPGGSALQAWIRDRRAAFDDLLAEYSGSKLAERERELAREPDAIAPSEGLTREYGQSGWHGSPHIFDKFDLNKVGTGEGAQAYGWGLYVAGKKAVGQHYREVLSREPNVDIKFAQKQVADARRRFEKLFSQEEKQKILAMTPDEFMSAVKAGDDVAIDVHGDLNAILDGAEDSRIKEAFEVFLGQKKKLTPLGRLYKVDIPEDGAYLHWDKPLSEQPPQVKSALEKAGLLNDGRDAQIKDLREKAQADFEENAPASFSQERFDRALNEAIESGDYGESFGTRVWDELKDAAPNIDWKAVKKELSNSGTQSTTGEGFYRKLADQLDAPARKAWVEKRDAVIAKYGLEDKERVSAVLAENPNPEKAASLALRDAGIAGIKYLDGSSRGAGEGTHNYVLFDDKLIKIRDYEQRQDLDQVRRGKVRFETGEKPVITLFKDADASTLVHEVGHTWLEELKRDAAHEKAPEQIRADFDTVKKWLGIGEDGKITTRMHEKWARGIERYAMEGVAPSAELAGVFERFKNWLVKIYQSVKDLRSPINDDIRAVMDRLISTEKAEKPIIAKEEPATGRGFADIHEADAKMATPATATVEADRIRAEVDEIARQVAPEVADELASGGPTAGGAAPTERAGGAVAEPGAASAPAGAAPKSGAVGEGGGGAAEEGVGARAKPAASGPGSEPPSSATARFEPPPSDLIDKAGNIRLDNLNTPESVNQVLREAAEQKNDFIEARRGVLSDEQVIDLADALGMDAGALDRRKIGEAFNAEQIVAARKLLVQSATKVRDLMAKVRGGGTDADVMAYAEARQRHLMIQEQVSGLTAEAGRALRAFRRLEGMEEATELSQFLQQSTGKTLNQLRREANAGAALETPQQVSKFVSDSKKPTFGERFVEGWMASLFTGPMTHLRNIAGNAVGMSVTLGEAVGAAALGKARNVLTGSNDRVLIGEVGARVYGMGRGAQEGVVAAWKAIKSDQVASGPLKGEQAHPFAIPDVKVKIGGREMSVGGSTIRAPLRLLSAADEFFKAIAFRSDIHAQSYKKAFDEGLTPGSDAFLNRMVALTDEGMEAGLLDKKTLADPKYDGVRPMIEAARRNADYLTYQQQLGPTGRAVQQFANSHPTMKVIIPFVRTPLNIIKFNMERTPLGVFGEETRANLMGKNGAAARDTQIARLGMGAAVGTAMYALVGEGMVTGGGPTEPNERRTLMMTGWQPYSVRIGESYYSYSWLPLGTLMGLAADTHGIADAVKEADLAKVTALTFASISKNLTGQTWLKGPSDIIEAISDPDRYGQNYINGMITSIVPSGVGWLARTDDPYQREARTLLDSFKAKIPGLSEELMPRRDIFGEPILRKREINDDPIVRKMLDLKVFPAKLDRKIRGVELTDQQYDDFARVGGRLMRVRLESLIMAPGFDTVPVGAQVKAIGNIIDHSREAARSLIMMQNPEIITKAIDNKVYKIETGRKPVKESFLTPTK